MNNEAVFQAEDVVEPRLASTRSRLRSMNDNPGSNAFNSAHTTEQGRDTEDAPLLGHRASRQSLSITPASTKPGDAAPSWPGYAEFEGLPWWRTPSVIWLLPPFLLFTLAFGGVVVPKLNLILNLICRQYLADRAVAHPDMSVMPVIFGGDNPQCRIPEVQSLVTRFTLYCNLIAGILSAITSPMLGALSDRYGRKRIIALTTFGAFLGEIITIVAATNPDTVSVNWILVGYIADGLCGSFIAAMALCNTYATDCTAPAHRNVAFGYFYGCLFGGIAAGPLVAGYIIKLTGTVLSVFWLALGCHLIFIIVLLFVIPESLSKRRQMAARERHRSEKGQHRPSTWGQLLNISNILAPLKILYPTGEGSSPALRMNLVTLASVDTIMFGVSMGAMTVVVYYSGYQFNWGNFESSLFVSAVNTGRVCALLIVLPLVTRLFRGRNGARPQRDSGSDLLDLSLIRIAVFFDMVGYLGYTLARTGPLFTVSGVVASFGGIGSPTIQSALTKHVPPDRTGQLLGASGLLHALARVVAPTIFNLIYSFTVGKYTQAVFVCLTATFGLAFVVSWFIRPHVYLDDTAAAATESSNNDDDTAAT
ncbi:MAG: hypothetical protein M1817_000899 [Caeruleum heppii]|nr:MAG: hypothetical protein M1817_000899 [Caeruleum heppii]